MEKLKKYLIITGLTLSALAGSGFTLLHFSIHKAYDNQNYSQTLKYIDIARNITSSYHDIHDDTLFSSAVRSNQKEYSWHTDYTSTEYKRVVNTWQENIIFNNKEISTTAYKELYNTLIEPKHNQPYSLSMPKIRSQYYEDTYLEKKEYTTLTRAIQLADSLSSHEAQRFKTICSVEIMNMYLASFKEIYLRLYPNVLLHKKTVLTPHQQPMLNKKVFNTKDHNHQLQVSLENYIQLFTEESENLLSQLSEEQKYIYSYGVNRNIQRLILSSELHIRNKFKHKNATLVLKNIAALYTIAKDLDNRYSFNKSSYDLSEKKHLDRVSNMSYQQIQQYLDK